MIERRYMSRCISSDYCKGWNDAVKQVGRCGECIHYELGVCLKIYDDGNVSQDAWQHREPDDYCSYFEPKKRSE